MRLDTEPYHLYNCNYKSAPRYKGFWCLSKIGLMSKDKQIYSLTVRTVSNTQTSAGCEAETAPETPSGEAGQWRCRAPRRPPRYLHVTGLFCFQ